MDYIKNDYELQKLALSIALEAIEEVKKHGGDHYELIDQAAASSEHAVYTYKAIMLCANCCTADAEEMLDDSGTAIDSTHSRTMPAYWLRLQFKTRHYRNFTI